DSLGPAMTRTMRAAVRLAVLVLVGSSGSAGCSTSDGGGGGPDYAGKSWVCCITDDGGGVVSNGFCECVARREGLAIDCFARGASSCPARPRCVVQGAGDTWSCACSTNRENLPTGSDVYPVKQCPP